MRTRDIKDHLPDKPSELLAKAMRDLKKAEDNPSYEINMEIWHRSYVNKYTYNYKLCSVCLAGVVMAINLGASPFCNLNPDDYKAIIRNKLWALNMFRKGYVKQALKCMKINFPDKLKEEYNIPYYKFNQVNFRKAMYRMIARLERVGL